MKHYLYNSLANNGIRPKVEAGIELIDAVGMDYPEYIRKMDPQDEIVLVGGDGTLNYFVNAVKGLEFPNNVCLFGCGTGNDFLKDIGAPAGEVVPIRKYLSGLPTVYVNGMEKLFFNNMGFGLDGYCCEEADRIKKEKAQEKIDYSGIAIRGLLFRFRPRHAVVTVDGVTQEYDNVWLAPAMKGRYYGGGIMMAPGQDRTSGLVTIVVYHCRSRLRSLIAFPSAFKGEHVKKKGIITVLTGKEVHVRFSEPCAAQIDGETVLNVTEYRVVSP